MNCIVRFRADVCVLRPWIPFRVSTTHSSVAPSSGSMITTSSKCGTQASAVYSPARLVEEHYVSLFLDIPVVNIPPPSDNDRPLQLWCVAFSPKDGEIINCSIYSEGTSYRILRINVPAQREKCTESECDKCPHICWGVCFKEFHCKRAVDSGR
jgi:hypothetical protein